MDRGVPWEAAQQRLTDANDMAKTLAEEDQKARERALGRERERSEQRARGYGNRRGSSSVSRGRRAVNAVNNANSSNGNALHEGANESDDEIEEIDMGDDETDSLDGFIAKEGEGVSFKLYNIPNHTSKIENILPYDFRYCMV